MGAGGHAGRLDFFGELAGLANQPPSRPICGASRSVEWVVYAKQPFGGQQQVLDYLDRCMHRVAIANNRLISGADGEVHFRLKVYRHPQRPKLLHARVPRVT
jgi:hypothetical protein